MADISKCYGNGCPLKEKCYRYTAIPRPHGQSYLNEVLFKDGECPHFWEDEEEVDYESST